MKTWFGRFVLCLLLPINPLMLGAQQATARPASSVLFVCEHGTVKSLLAKLLFDEYAAEVGPPVSGDSIAGGVVRCSARGDGHRARLEYAGTVFRP